MRSIRSIVREVRQATIQTSSNCNQRADESGCPWDFGWMGSIWTWAMGDSFPLGLARLMPRLVVFSPSKSMNQLGLGEPLGLA